VAPVLDPESGALQVALLPGPRRDWFTDAAWQTLLGSAYTGDE
jgi:hypothetical protein